MSYGMSYAKAENLVKVVETKQDDGSVFLPARMRRDSFMALVRAGWLKEEKKKAPVGHWRDYVIVYTVTAEGEKALASQAQVESNPFVGGHGQKAQETFRLLDTKHSDWFHPAVRWVRETRNMPFESYKTCPTCDGLKYVQFDAEGKVVPPPPRAAEGSYDYKAEQARQEYSWKGRNAKNGRAHAWNGNCPTCTKYARNGRSECSGRVFDKMVWKPVEMMVGYIIWPKGVQHSKSRFAYNQGNSALKCALCGKGINKSGRVPLAHDKDGKPLSMWVGEDCARKFAKVAKLAPSKVENSKKLEYLLDDNYIKQGEE